MKKFRAALKNKSNWPSLATLVLILGCSLFSFWDTKFSEQARSAAFALVAVEFFIMLVVHLEEVKGAIGEIRDDAPKGVQLSKWNNNLDGQIIKEAEEELFFSGYDISRLGLNREELLALSERIQVRLLAMNMDDKTVRELFEATFGREPGQKSLDHLRPYASKTNIKIHTIDFPMSIYVTARDINKATGRMQVGFLSYTKSGYNSHCLDLTTADKDWYDYYKTQIDLLWTASKEWTPQTKEGTP